MSTRKKMGGARKHLKALVIEFRLVGTVTGVALLMAWGAVPLLKSTSWFVGAIGMILGLPFWLIAYLPIRVAQILVFLFSGYWDTLPSLPPAFDALIAEQSLVDPIVASIVAGLCSALIFSAVFAKLRLCGWTSLARTVMWGAVYGVLITWTWLLSNVPIFGDNTLQHAARYVVSVLQWVPDNLGHAVGFDIPDTMPPFVSHYYWVYFTEDAAVLALLNGATFVSCVVVWRIVYRQFSKGAGRAT